MSLSTRFVGALLCLSMARKGNRVNGQTQVQGFIGDDVLLPCIFTDVNQIPSDQSVDWMNKDDKVLLKMTRAGPDSSKQDPKYKDRVVALQEPFKTGNFSVQLKNCQPSDSGRYRCFIWKLDFEREVVLNISGERVATTKPPSGSSGSPGSPGSRSGGAAAAAPSALFCFLCLLCCPLCGQI